MVHGKLCQYYIVPRLLPAQNSISRSRGSYDIDTQESKKEKINVTLVDGTYLFCIGTTLVGALVCG